MVENAPEDRLINRPALVLGVSLVVALVSGYALWHEYTSGATTLVAAVGVVQLPAILLALQKNS